MPRREIPLDKARGISMPKRQENIVTLLLQCPWWISAVLAVIAYVMLKFVIPNIEFQNPIFKSMTSVAPKFAGVASVFFLLLAGVSAFNLARKRELFNRQSGIDTIRSLSWREFEELLAEAYRRQGYTVRENTSAGPDGGVDIVIEKGRNVYLVQCKQWRNSKVGVNVVREMYGLMAAEKAFGTIIVTSGLFTQEAKNFSHGKSIDLVEGNQLVDLIRNVQGQSAVATTTAAPSPHITCPRCGQSLVVKEARRGANAGNKFLGCANFPSCRYTQPC